MHASTRTAAGTGAPGHTRAAWPDQPCFCAGERRAERGAPWDAAFSSLSVAGMGPIHMNEVQCTGSEKSLWSCPHKNITAEGCKHSEDAGVRCNIPYMGYETTVSHATQDWAGAPPPPAQQAGRQLCSFAPCHVSREGVGGSPPLQRGPPSPRRLRMGRREGPAHSPPQPCAEPLLLLGPWTAPPLPPSLPPRRKHMGWEEPEGARPLLWSKRKLASGRSDLGPPAPLNWALRIRGSPAGCLEVGGGGRVVLLPLPRLLTQCARKGASAGGLPSPPLPSRWGFPSLPFNEQSSGRQGLLPGPLQSQQNLSGLLCVCVCGGGYRGKIHLCSKKDQRLAFLWGE